jgi:hypothetical protein
MLHIDHVVTAQVVSNVPVNGHIGSLNVLPQLHGILGSSSLTVYKHTAG